MYVVTLSCMQLPSSTTKLKYAHKPDQHLLCHTSFLQLESCGKQVCWHASQVQKRTDLISKGVRVRQGSLLALQQALVLLRQQRALVAGSGHFLQSSVDFTPAFMTLDLL